MVQRYRFNYVQEMFETDTGEQHNETERGEWVKCEDYAKLKEMYDALCEKWLEVNGQHGALCDACISYGLEPTEMIKDEMSK